MIPMTLSEISSVLNISFSGEDRVVSGVSTDSRRIGENELFAAIAGERFDGHDFVKDLNCAAALTERDTEVGQTPVLRVSSTLEALGVLGRYNHKKAGLSLTLSLTGSVGKTTTKEMCALVLKEKYNTFKTQGNLNNHIGVPLTLLSLEKEHEALVCEMGMNHSGEISYLAGLVKSDISIITNIGSSHIENLGSRENIAKAKLEILEGLKANGVLLVNGDEPLLEKIDIPQRVVRVGFGENCAVRAENVTAHAEGVEFDCEVFGERVHTALPIPGRHNVYNALFAIAVGALCGIGAEASAKALAEYVPTGMRQKIYTCGKSTIVADCYNAGIESMCASLEALRDMKENKLSIAVLGDMLELGSVSEEFHRKVGRKAAECGVDVLVSFGDMARYIALEAKERGLENAFFFEDKADAARKLSEYVGENAVFLFKASRGMKCEEIISLLGLNEK